MSVWMSVCLSLYTDAYRSLERDASLDERFKGELSDKLNNPAYASMQQWRQILPSHRLKQVHSLFVCIIPPLPQVQALPLPSLMPYPLPQPMQPPNSKFSIR